VAMTLDRAALRQGAWVALVFAVPFSIGSRLMADHDRHSPWTSVLWLAALAGFTLGAGIAAWVQRTGFPLLHGLVCAGGTYIAAQAVFIVIKLFRGGTISWLGVFFTFTVVLTAGLVGGGLGSALRKRGLVPLGERGPSASSADGEIEGGS
jgi:peptidoglycan/LPS O-acetylase OafA/YrhL